MICSPQLSTAGILFKKFVYRYLLLALFFNSNLGYSSPYLVSKNIDKCNQTVQKNGSHTNESNTTYFHLANSTFEVKLPPSSTVQPNGYLKLGATHLQTARNAIVVFDIDDTICKEAYYCEDVKDYAECPRIWWTHKETGDKYLYIFLPYLEILFNYLLEHGTRIVFFSGGVAERNLFVISELLESFWGRKKYEALKVGGQFYIYSKDDLTQKKYRNNYFKDLRKIICSGEYLSNIILVDDSYSNTVKNQQPFIVVNRFLLSEEEDISLNSIYYMLGLFKTYFENERYKKLPIRDAMAHILPTNHPPSCRCYPDNRASPPPFKEYIRCEKHPFLLDMIDIGLKAVQERVPNATLYVKTYSYYSWKLM